MWVTRTPDHAFKRLHAAAQEDEAWAPDEPLQEAVTRVLRGDSGVPDEIIYATSIYFDPYKREVLEAFVIARAKNADIEEVLGIPPDVVDIYLAVFFDRTVFRDRLDLESYIRRYPETHDGGFGKRWKIAALEQGLTFLKASFGRGSFAVSPVDALEEQITQAYLLSKVPAYATVSSDGVKEARAWSGTLVTAVRAHREAQSSEGQSMNEFKIQLMMIKSRRDYDDIDPDDIVHVHPADLDEDPE